MHIGPYVTLPNESIGDLGAWVSRLMKHVKHRFTKGLRDIWADGFTSDFAEDSGMSRAPLNALQRERVVRRLANGLKLLIGFLFFSKLVEIDLYGESGVGWTLP